jgi:hypothetical protein
MCEVEGGSSLIRREHTCGSYEFVVLAHVHLQQQVKQQTNAPLLGNHPGL